MVEPKVVEVPHKVIPSDQDTFCEASRLMDFEYLLIQVEAMPGFGTGLDQARECRP